MPVRHDFASDHPLPVFLSSDAERYEEPRRSSYLVKAGVFVAAAIVIGAAMTLSLGNPMNLFAVASPADNAALQVDSAAAQPTADPSPTSPAQSTADAGQAAGAAPSRDDATAAADTAAAPAAGALLKQFQSWATQQDTQTQVDPAQDAPTQIEPVRPIVNAQPQTEPEQPLQAAPTTQVMQDDPPAPVRTVQKHRKARPVQNARAEVRIPKPRPTAGARPDRNARADARPQDPAAQPAQAQSSTFLQSIGLTPRQ